MAESPGNGPPTDKELEAKRVAFYQVLLSAWVQNRMDRDKALLSLSSAAIGLLVTLLSTGIVKDWLRLIPYAIGLLCFGISIWFLLKVLNLNSDYIGDALKTGDSKQDLKAYDRLVNWSFLFGVFFLVVIGLNAGVAAIASKEEGDAANEKPKSRPTTKVESRESHQGVSELRPTESTTVPRTSKGGTMSTEKKVVGAEMQKSLQGLTELRPQSQNQGQSQTGSQSGKDEGKK